MRKFQVLGAVFIILGFIVIAVAFALVADYVSCNINIVFSCADGSGGGYSRGGKQGGSLLNTLLGGNGAGNTTNSTSGGSNASGGSSGSSAGVPQACQSAGANECGDHGTGFIVNGSCNALPPPNSACPSPVIDGQIAGEASGKIGFIVDPDRLRAGNTTTLYWSATRATKCSIVGGGLTLTNLPLVGSRVSNPITAKTIFTLTCINGTGGPKSSRQATVNLVPNYQEL